MSLRRLSKDIVRRWQENKVDRIIELFPGNIYYTSKYDMTNANKTLISTNVKLEKYCKEEF